MKRIGKCRSNPSWIAIVLAFLFAGCRGAADEAVVAQAPVASSEASGDEGDNRAYGFRTMNQRLPARTVPRSTEPRKLGRAGQALAIEYEVLGQRFDIEDFVTRTDTTGLLVLRDGVILYEGYFQGADETSRFLSMSVAKSFTSTLLGLARDKGLIENFDPFRHKENSTCRTTAHQRVRQCRVPWVSLAATL